MKKYKLSIIVPVYNVEKYLRKCLDSLINQSSDDYEIIVVNDGSTDNSLEICTEYKHYKNINIFNKKNGGLSSARNYGIDKANGEYISFVDSDDWVSEDYVSSLLAKIDEDNELDVIAYDVILINDGWSEGTIRKLYYDFDNMTRNDIIKECYNPSYAWARIYKKELISKYRFPSENLWYEDMYIMPELLANCSKVGYIEKALYFYRQRNNSITTSAFNKKTLAVIDAWEINLKNMKKEYMEDYILALYKSIVSFIYFKPEYSEEFINFYKKYEKKFKDNKFVKKIIKNDEYEDLSKKQFIPKKLYYCWYGKGKKGDLFEKCYESWKKYAPDFEIIELNEDNCDINECVYVKEAYEAKKWAYVADYFRIKVLKETGGIYVDTDVELKKYIHELTLNDSFFAFETNEVNAAIFGTIPNTKIINEIYKSYINDKFILEDGTYNTNYPIPQRITNILQKITNIKLNGKTQKVNDIMIYSADILTINVYNDKNIAEHHYEATWWDVTYGIQSYKYTVLQYYFKNNTNDIPKETFKQKLRKKIVKLIPKKLKKIIKKIIGRG